GYSRTNFYSPFSNRRHRVKIAPTYFWLLHSWRRCPCAQYQTKKKGRGFHPLAVSPLSSMPCHGFNQTACAGDVYASGADASFSLDSAVSLLCYYSPRLPQTGSDTLTTPDLKHTNTPAMLFSSLRPRRLVP